MEDHTSLAVANVASYGVTSLAGLVKGIHFQALTCFLPSLALGCL